MTISYEDFERVEMRVGRIVDVQDFPRARKPSCRLRIDFGEAIGERWSSAQVTNYAKEALVGMLVVAVVNFPPKNIAGFQSECLVLGASTDDDHVSILTPSLPAVVGSRIF